MEYLSLLPSFSKCVPIRIKRIREEEMCKNRADNFYFFFFRTQPTAHYFDASAFVSKSVELVFHIYTRDNQNH